MFSNAKIVLYARTSDVMGGLRSQFVMAIDTEINKKKKRIPTVLTFEILLRKIYVVFWLN